MIVAEVFEDRAWLVHVVCEHEDFVVALTSSEADSNESACITARLRVPRKYISEGVTVFPGRIQSVTAARDSHSARRYYRPGPAEPKREVREWY